MLSAYLRRHAPHKRHADDRNDGGSLPALPASDIQAAVSVLGRRPPDPRSNLGWRWRLDLHGADLRAVRILDADFQGVVLAGADPEAATLFKAELRKASLVGASLRYAVLGGASLRGADLRNANLEGIRTIRELDGGSFRDSYGASDFHQADLRAARLHDADLRFACNLNRADLTGATASPGTSWPAGFRWREAGVEVEQDRRQP